MIPNFNYLSDMLQSPERTIACIKRRPFLLYYDLQTNMENKVDILLECGVPKSNIFLYMCGWWSYSSITDNKVFREVVEEVKEMGFNPFRSQFLEAISLKTTWSRSLWESKVNMYKRWGWSDEELLGAFQKLPRIMALPKDNVMSTMDFFVNKMGLESSYIAKHPRLILHSLQKRIIPRAVVFQFLLTKSLIKDNYTSLVALMMYSEKNFLKRFVNCSDEAPQLLKLSQEKLDLSKITR